MRIQATAQSASHGEHANVTNVNGLGGTLCMAGKYEWVFQYNSKVQNPMPML